MKKYHSTDLYPMTSGRVCRPTSQPPTSGTTENPWHPRDRRRHLLRPEERLPLEPTVYELSALGNRLLIVREMAHGGAIERLNAALRKRLRARLVGTRYLAWASPTPRNARMFARWPSRPLSSKP